MQRIHAPFDEPTLAQIDQEVEKKGISRAQWLNSVVLSYLRLIRLTKGADPSEMIPEMAQLRSTNESLNEAIRQLKLAEEKARSDAAQAGRKQGALEEQVAQAEEQAKAAKVDSTQRWEETKSLKSEITRLKKAHDEAQATIHQLQSELIERQDQVNKAFNTTVELAGIRAERDKLQEALKVRDEDIAYFKAHVSQLTQTVNQLSLPPSQEEAKAKHWYQFWK